MYVIWSEVRFVEISPPNECDKILKISNEQTEPTDYMANCSTDTCGAADTKQLYKHTCGAADTKQLYKHTCGAAVMLQKLTWGRGCPLTLQTNVASVPSISRKFFGFWSNPGAHVRSRAIESSKASLFSLTKCFGCTLPSRNSISFWSRVSKWETLKAFKTTKTTRVHYINNHMSSLHQ